VANKQETVVAALVAQLAAISGGSYAYPPTAVRRVSFFDEAFLDPTLTTIYLVRPGKEDRRPQTSSEMRAALEIYVLAATAYSSPNEQPAVETSPTRWQAAADLVADIEQCLALNATLGGVAIDSLYDGLHIDYERYLPKWAAVEIAFTVKYRHQTGGR
jgi:hypothetical protein